MAHINQYSASFLQLFVLFTITIVSSILFLQKLIHTLKKFNIVDTPSERRAHRQITPRGGGIAVVIIFILGFSIVEYINKQYLSQSYIIIPAVTLISYISFLDDLKHIPALLRLIIHFACSIFTIKLFFASIIINLSILKLEFWILVITLTAFLNIYNFLDGIDGMTAIESIHLASIIIILAIIKRDIVHHLDFILITATIIMGYSICFLKFNWPPAKIFLGDVGSITIGFLIGLCLLMLAASDLSLCVAVITASLYYLADGGITILLRIIKKEKFWQPHLKHFFQQAARNGMSNKEILSNITKCNIILMLISIISLYFPWVAIISGVEVTSLLLKFKTTKD